MTEKLSFPGGSLEIYEGYQAHCFAWDGCPCILVEPRQPLPGKPWVWKAEFFEAYPKFELEMRRRGYYLAYMSVGNTFGCPDAMEHFDHFYEFLTASPYGFHRRPVLLGLSRGGLYIYNWASRNPDRVGCIYGDNPVCDFLSWPGGKGVGPGSPEDWEKLLKDYHFANEEEARKWPSPLVLVEKLLQNGVPLMHAAATDDEVVPYEENTVKMEERVRFLGGTLKVFAHPGLHHPHGLEDPAPLADWVQAHTRP